MQKKTVEEHEEDFIHIPIRKLPDFFASLGLGFVSYLLIFWSMVTSSGYWQEFASFLFGIMTIFYAIYVLIK